MYLEHYGLREPPFSITPDPRFVFLSERHRDALAHLLYGIGQGGGSGFVQLTGEVGTGKTTLSRLLLEQLPANARVALILNPLLSPAELLETICEELHLDVDGPGLDGRRGNVKALVDALNAHLLEAHAAGLRVVLIIDEAQNLSPAALEQVRLLTNLETATQKLLQIILLGQPELREMLARPELRQLAQRITARHHLDPLDPGESDAYLRHRWAVAGGGAFPFTAAAVKRMHRHAGGIPRLLNVIADRALLAGYARGERTVGEGLLEQAAREVLPARTRSSRWRLAAAVLALVVVTAIAADAFRLRWPAPAGAGPAATVHHTTRAPVAPVRLAQAARPQGAMRAATSEAVVPVAVVAFPVIDAARFAQRIDAGDGDAAPAWRDLLALWSVPAGDPPATAPSSCPSSKDPGLFCTSGRQRLSLLAQFDRPLLLRLHHGTHQASALLLGLGPTQALLRLDGERFIVRRTALETALDGYAMVGRGTGGLELPAKHGDTGAGVGWLRHRLALANTAAGQPDAYDDAVVDAVRIRQRDFGLRPDGVVGPETLFALTAADAEGPHLRRLPE